MFSTFRHFFDKIGFFNRGARARRARVEQTSWQGLKEFWQNLGGNTAQPVMITGKFWRGPRFEYLWCIFCVFPNKSHSKTIHFLFFFCAYFLRYALSCPRFESLRCVFINKPPSKSICCAIFIFDGETDALFSYWMEKLIRFFP